MTIEEITPPRREPIHLKDAQAVLKWTSAKQDDHILALIRSARQYAERYLRRSLVQKTIRLRLNNKEARSRLGVILHRPPFLKLDTFKVYDGDNVEVSLGTATYQIAGSDPVRLIEDGDGWIGLGRQHDAAIIEYRTGYSSPITDVNTSTNKLTLVDHPFADTDRVRLTNSGGRLPSPLLPETDYFIRAQVTDTVELALTSGGSAIDIDEDGSGNSFVSKTGGIPDDIIQGMHLFINDRFYRRTSYPVTPAGSKSSSALGANRTSGQSIIESILDPYRYHAM